MEGVTSIGEYAFSQCTVLTSISIPNSVETLEAYSFMSCYKLESVVIGSGVTAVGYNAFNSDTALETIYYLGTADEWNAIQINNLYNTNGNFVDATRYYYSAEEPTAQGNFWHYAADGVTPVAW